MKKLFLSVFALALVAAYASGNRADYAVWQDRGVLGEHGYLTYNDMASVMLTLLNYRISDRYTFNSGHLYIPRYQAFVIMARALNMRSSSYIIPDLNISEIPVAARRYIGYLFDNGYLNELHRNRELRPLDPLTTADLATFLSNLFVEFINGPQSDFGNRTINGNVIVHLPMFTPESAIDNLDVTGNIFVVSNRASVYINNAAVRGDIAVVGNGHPSFPFALTNVTAQSLNIHAPAYIHLTGNGGVNNINIRSAANVAVTTRQTPEVAVYSTDVELFGGFGRIYSRNGGQVIRLYGHASSLRASSNAYISGAATIDYTEGSVFLMNSVERVNIHLVYADIIMDILGNYLYFADSLIRSMYSFQSSIILQMNRDIVVNIPPIQLLPIIFPTPEPPTEGPDIPLLPSPPPTPPLEDEPTDNANDTEDEPTEHDDEQEEPPTPPSAYSYIDHVTIQIRPPNVDGVMQRDVSGVDFTGAAAWYDEAGVPVNGFSAAGRYLARITIEPISQHRFADDMAVDNIYILLEYDTLRFDIKSYNITPNAIEIRILFDPIGRLSASAFHISIPSSESTHFDIIHIHTEDLGSLNIDNFAIYFGLYAGEAGARVGITAVSAFQPSGYYEIALNQPLLHGGGTLFVAMRDPLPYHYAWPEVVELATNPPIGRPWANPFYISIPSFAKTHFDIIHIHTEDLGNLNINNFLIYFGSYAGEAGANVGITAVSAFQPGGYYEIILNRPLLYGGGTVFVAMLGPLPYHYAWPGVVELATSRLQAGAFTVSIPSSANTHFDTIRIHTEDLGNLNIDNFAIYFGAYYGEVGANVGITSVSAFQPGGYYEIILNRPLLYGGSNLFVSMRDPLPYHRAWPYVVELATSLPRANPFHISIPSFANTHFDIIHIHTEDLGNLNINNFVIYFGAYAGEAGANVGITTVSAFQSGGYYEITLNQPLLYGGGTLFVSMRDPLPYHRAWPYVVELATSLPRANPFLISIPSSADTHFDIIHIHTEDLGGLNIDNFVIYFGAYFGEAGADVGVASVSAFQPGGYYKITLNQPLLYGGDTLFVAMRDPLPYHRAWTEVVELATGRPRAGAFTVSIINEEFFGTELVHGLRIHSQYLGTLTHNNFVIYYGEEWQLISSVRHSADGYYIVEFFWSISRMEGNRNTFYVKMQNLPYHEPWPYIVTAQ